MSAQRSSDFLKYIGTPFQRYILPIIPVGAKLSEESHLSPDQLGKIPGTWAHGPRVWYGLSNWPQYYTTHFDLERWQKWQDPDKAGVPIAIALRLRVLIAIDIDINHLELADEAEALVVRSLGLPLGVRRREGSARRVLIYLHKPRTMPITKSRVAFKTPLTGEEVNAVEILGEGQQVVIEGPHAKGAMHYWLDGKGLTELSIDELKRAPQLTPIDALGLHKHLHDWVKGNENEGWELHGLRALQGRDRKAECRIKDPTSGLRANDLALLKHAIEAIDIEHVNLASYDAWFPLFLAICAACGGDMNFFHETVLPWLLRFPGNTEEDMEAKWLQQQTSTIGAEYVYRVAAAEPFNCKEAIDALAPTQETLSALFGDPVSAVGTAASTAAEDNSVVPAVDGNTNGPFPARDTDKYLAERFVEQHRHEWRYAIDQGWVTLKNGLWLPDTTVLYAIGELCSAEGDRYRTTGGQGGSGIDKQLKSTAKHRSVKSQLEAHPSIVVRPEEWDTDPWLLNTPAGVVDIRTCETRPHTSADLMRMQTVVSPNWAAQGFYQFFCPEWMQYINFLANGDERYVRLLRRYGALCLTGYERDLYFLFMWGVPNSAKSVFQDVLQRLQGNYIKSVSPGFFMRQLDKRTFELYQLKGRRGAFADEVPKGGTWDVQLLSTMFSGRQLQAEGKGKAFIEFRNTAKVIVAGNHQPRFPSSNEKDGLDRRMLLLEFDRTVEQGGIKDDRMFPVKVVEAEGSAILMWFLEDAQAGYQDLLEQGSFMGDTVDIGLELAAKYRLKANPHNQWVDEGAIRDPEATMPAKTAWYLYMEWGDRQGLWKHQKKETYDDFVTAMRTIGFFVKCPTDHRKGRAMLIYGLREQTYSSADLAAAE